MINIKIPTFREEEIVQVWLDSLKDFDFDNPFPILSQLISEDLGK